MSEDDEFSGGNEFNIWAAIENGNLNFVKKFIEVDRNSVEFMNDKEDTLLHYAVDYNQFEICQYLIHNNANANAVNEDGKTLLHYAMDTIEIVELLVEHGANVNAKDKYGFNCLYYMDEDDLSILNYLINNSIDIHCKNDHGDTLLHHFALKRLTECCKCLLENGLDMYCENFNGKSPIHCVNDEATCDCFIKHGVDLNFKNRKGKALLHIAAKTLGEDFCFGLIESGANIHAKTKKGDSVLHFAAARKEKLCKYLIDHGIDVNITNNSLQTPLYFSMCKETCKLLIEKGAQINRIDTKGYAPLYSMCKPFNDDAVLFLIKQQNLAVDVVATDGSTPLCYIVSNCKLDTLRLLIQEKRPRPNIHVKSSTGDTLLHYAASNITASEVLEYLISLGLNIKATNNFGKTVLHSAAECSSKHEILNLLIEKYKLNTAAKDIYGNTVLHYLCKNRDLGFWSKEMPWIEWKSAIQEKNCKGETPLFNAAKFGHYSTFRLLMKNGADVTIQNLKGQTPLHVAIKHNDSLKVRDLLDEGADSNAKSNKKQTPLFRIAKFNCKRSFFFRDILDKLAKYNVNWNAQDEKENTVLHTAAKRGNITLCIELKKRGCDLTIKNKHGQTARDIATDYRIRELLALEDTVTKSLKEINEDLIHQIEETSFRISHLVELNQQLEQQVKKLKSNEITFALSELKLQNQIAYDQLIERLSQVQHDIMKSEHGENMQQLISKRSEIRKQIVSVIDAIQKELETKIEENTRVTMKQILQKKIEYIYPMKEQVENDLKIESQIQQVLDTKPLSELQETLEEKISQLRVLEALAKAKPKKYEEDISELKQEIQDLEQQIMKQKQVITLYGKRSNPLFGFPEIQSLAMNSVPQEQIQDLNKEYMIERWFGNTCVAVHKSFVSSNMNSNKRIKLEGEKVFIKKYDKIQDWRHFKNEVETLKRLHHKCIISINRVFYDDHFYYIEMPFIEGGTLLEWVGADENKRSPFEVQQITKYIAQTIDYLHENGVVHRDLKMENIMTQQDTLPVIIDFDMSKDSKNSNRVNTSTMRGGTLKYIDPQVLWSKKSVNTCSDVYNFGIILYICFSKHPSKTEVFPLPNKEVPDIDANSLIVQDEDLIHLLKKCLHIQQEKRPNAKEISQSRFFLKHMSNEKEAEKLEEAKTRIDAFKQFVHEKRSQFYEKDIDDDDDNEIIIKINEDSALVRCTNETLLSACSNGDQIYHKCRVQFKGQAGVDEGALTTSLFRKYFEQCHVLQLLKRGTSCSHICTDKELDTLLSDAKQRKEYCVGLGVTLCKCLYEGRSTGNHLLSNSLLHYLICKDTTHSKCTLLDLEQFDRNLSQQFRNFRLMDFDEIKNMRMDFSDLKPNGDAIDLSDANLEEYILLKMNYEMIESRRRNLDWIREGFYKMETMKTHLQLLSVNEYHILLNGEQMIDITSIVDNCLVALQNNFEKSAQHLVWLKQVLKKLSQQEFKLFLLFCTGYCTTQSKDKLFENANLTSSYNLDKINVQWVKEWKSDRLPEAHVCFYRLDLPFYQNEQQMEQKLKLAISSTPDEYGIV